MQAVQKQTLVDQITSNLVRAILRGDYALEESLPPIRQLAQTLDVTVATMQRVIARLQEMGLLQVRQGSGMRVTGLGDDMDLHLLGQLIYAVQDDPQQASVLLSQFLDLRRDLAFEIMRRLRDLNHANWQPIYAAFAQMKAQLDKPMTTSNTWLELDLALSKAMVLTLRHQGYLALFNTLTKLLRDLPHLQSAMYAEPTQNIAIYGLILDAIDQNVNDEVLREMICGDTAAQLDLQIVEMYRTRLEDSQ